ncbi:DNA primase [Brevibacterium yomogidense]|uniref:DNA primase n=1 Tax=Brevibacterium yomogidense TaxID=946573 RepID=UPI0018DFE780|nr:DNA primase [Brevibacterium yomogidense]
MAGLIKREDIDEVRSRARLDDVVGEFVTLRTAGVGSLKGLCPFHDERTPSFHVRPQVGMYHCFGCGESGDVFTFLQKLDGVTFVEAVERMAERTGVQLRYEEGTKGPDREEVGRRQRLVEMHQIAEEFYRRQMEEGEAQTAREYLTARGFDSQALTQFGVGYAPRGWDNLLRALRGRGFTTEEIAASGLVSEGRRGVYDRFRGRIMWPIRDVTGRTIGFGARKLYEDDQGPKYLNTPETALYKKAQVLYGLDLAKREISRSKRVVIVEGYTDVMAAHLAGVGQAVATCGTAFGEEHAKIVSRLLGDESTGAGEVVFTFDGDEAGQKAALKAFELEQRFVAQTFVAVEASGRDPSDLRSQDGDAAVRDLVDGRRPLFEFAITSAIARFDLSTVEGRVGAMRAAAPVVASIRDSAMRPGYERFVAGQLGVSIDEVAEAVRRAKPAGGGRTGRSGPGGPGRPGGAGRGSGSRVPGSRGPGGQDVRGQGGYDSRGRDPRRQGASGGQGAPGLRGLPGGAPGSPYEPATAGRIEAYAEELGGPMAPVPEYDPVAVRIERSALQVALQQPQFVNATLFDGLNGEVFTHPDLRSVHVCMQDAGGIRTGLADPSGWPEKVMEAAAARSDDRVRSLVGALSVEPLPAEDAAGVERYSRGIIARLFDSDMARIASELHSRLQRTDPGDLETSSALLNQLQILEQQRARIRQLM